MSWTVRAMQCSTLSEQRGIYLSKLNYIFRTTLQLMPHFSSKSVSYAVWYPELQRAHVTVARGIHFQNMGYSVSRVSKNSEGVFKAHKRLELLPEEALYLVERGAMFCWKACDLISPELEDSDQMAGIPMSVQEAYAEMIATEDLSLEKYQACHFPVFLIQYRSNTTIRFTRT